MPPVPFEERRALLTYEKKPDSAIAEIVVDGGMTSHSTIAEDRRHLAGGEGA